MLNAQRFESIADLRALTDQVAPVYNHERPHDSPSRVPLITFSGQQQRVSHRLNCPLDGKAYESARVLSASLR